MIIVSVHLVSAITGKVTELARAHISNIGGTGTVRDYEIKTLRGRNSEALGRGLVQRQGKVQGHRALDLHVWHLVAKALTGIGYGPRPSPGLLDAPADSEADRLRAVLRSIASQTDPRVGQQLARDEIGCQELADA